MLDGNNGSIVQIAGFRRRGDSWTNQMTSPQFRAGGVDANCSVRRRVKVVVDVDKNSPLGSRCLSAKANIFVVHIVDEKCPRTHAGADTSSWTAVLRHQRALWRATRRRNARNPSGFPSKHVRISSPLAPLMGWQPLSDHKLMGRWNRNKLDARLPAIWVVHQFV